MEAPRAALAVAMMIAMAATSARSDRASASFFFRVIGRLNSFRYGFRFVYLAWSISPLRFLCPLPASYAQLLFRLRCFDFASPQKVPNGSSTRGAFANLDPNRQIKFLFEPVQRFCISEKLNVSGHFHALTMNRLFPERRLCRRQSCNRDAKW